MILDIPEIPPDLFQQMDRYRGHMSREEYVLFLIQRAVLGGKPPVFSQEG